ncbi:FAD-dependent thymidylate synthase [Duganella sp. FT27W]|uniref:FAD-dependent thymidylate synthase n=1 Tax=Duganella sp. FT27W TaxID=2654636 RepID=UPI00128C183B|nr:FAD-dependent thymidylate synthase [Duganella sp. FT27W]MPQ56361.1 hypothetical protein [Duganella sp. FT27W]
MSATVKIIEHSIAPNGKELVTFQVKYQRFIHAEAKTHRAMTIADQSVELLQEVGLMDCADLSRNASSSRAIPVNKMIAATLADPAFFSHVGKNQPGMQAREEVSPEVKAQFKKEWIELAEIVGGFVDRWSNGYGIHKQVANRALEPWQHISVIVTATELDNFFALRDHVDAQPEIRDLAILMKAALASSTPTLRTEDPGRATSWHLPYVTAAERLEYHGQPAYLAQLSAARCARVSYLTHDGQAPSVEKDIALFMSLVGSEPLHASPVEHQAYPLLLSDTRCKNFVGWQQYRQIVEQSFIK